MRSGRKQKLHIIFTVRAIATVLLVGIAQGCATSRVEQISDNEFSMSTLASPVCDTAGQKKAQLKAAAVNTLERGYDRFRVFARDDTGKLVQEIDFSGVISLAGYDTSGLNPLAVDIPHLKMQVRMYHNEERGAAGAIPAREVLGPDWKKELNREKSWTCTS